MKTVIKILLGISIIFLAYICVDSVVTPIQFEKEKALREKDVVARLVQIRAAQLEFKAQYGRYTADLDSLVNFVKTAKKKEVKKEGALTEKQLEDGLTEAKAVKIVLRGNAREIKENGLEGFRRDTILTPMITFLYKGAYSDDNISELVVVPHSNGKRFEMEVNNEYVKNNIPIPLFEARTPFDTYLADLNHQELVNAKDVAVKLDKYPGLKVGSVVEPNNNAGNWE